MAVNWDKIDRWHPNNFNNNLDQNETEDHAEWLSGIVITDVRSMKDDAQNPSNINNVIENEEIFNDTDSEGEEVDVENLEEELDSEPQCDALRKLTNLSIVELENQALCLSEEDHLQEFLKITLDGTAYDESESSDSEEENNACLVLKNVKHVDRNAYDTNESQLDLKKFRNTINENKLSFRYPCDHLPKARDSSVQKTDQQSSFPYFISNNERLNSKFKKDSYKPMPNIHVQSHLNHAKQRIIKEQKQNEICRELLKKYYPKDVFDEPELIDVIPNFAGFTPKICQTPKHKLWRVKHLNKFNDDSNTNTILYNIKETTNAENVIQDLSTKSCLFQSLDSQPDINNDKVIEINNKVCSNPGQLVKKNSKAEKFHDGIMTRKRTAQFKEIFTNDDNVEINNSNLDGVNLRSKHVENDIDQLINSNQNFSKNTYNCNRHLSDLGEREKVTKRIEFDPDTYISKSSILHEKQLSYDMSNVNLSKGNLSKYTDDNSKLEMVKLHMNETSTKALNAFSNKEEKEKNDDLNLQPFHNNSQDEIVIDWEAPRSFYNGNRKLGVSTALIRQQGYKRKLSFGSDGSVSDKLALEGEISAGGNFFNDRNINLELKNKRSSWYPLVSLKRCDENIGTVLYSGNQISVDKCFTDSTIIAKCGVTLRPSDISTLEKINYTSKSKPPLIDDSDLNVNVKVSFQSVSDAVKNVSKVGNENIALHTNNDLDVNESILSGCMLETKVSSSLRRPALDRRCFQNDIVGKDNNINIQKVSHDCYELPVDKSLVSLKPPHFSNHSSQSRNCESKLEVRPSDNSRLRHSVFNKVQENKENCTESILNLQCSVCLENVPKKSILNHMSVHIKDDNFICNKCNSCFIDLYSLKEHYPICDAQSQCLVKSEETSSVQFRCSICDHCFKLKYDYDNHLKFHVGLANYMCEICGFAFISELLLNSHKSTHFEPAASNYSCDVCFRKCNGLQDKIQHEKSHSICYKPLYCVKCSKCFSDAVSLQLHQKTFHVISNYECKKCELTFIHVSEMEDHYFYSHFFCYKCDLSFSCLKNIRDHVSSHHSVSRISDCIQVVNKDLAKQYEVIEYIT